METTTATTRIISELPDYSVSMESSDDSGQVMVYVIRNFSGDQVDSFDNESEAIEEAASLQGALNWIQSMREMDRDVIDRECSRFL